MTNYLPVENIRRAAYGHWDNICLFLAPSLKEATARPGKHGPCPKHGGKDAFRLFPNYAENGACVCNTCGVFRDGFATLAWLNGWSFRKTLEEVARFMGLMPDAHASVPDVNRLHNDDPRDRHDEVRDKKERAESIRRARAITGLWNWSIAFQWELRIAKAMTAYLLNRGLGDINKSFLDDLRFHPRAYYHGTDGEPDGSYPAMVAAVRTVAGRLVTLHKTYLTDNGRKAPVAAPKQIQKLPADRTVTGCSVHFGTPRKTLALAEGIETALSVVKVTGLPCWACLSAHGLEAVEVPQAVTRVFVFADKDRSGTGQKAAGVLATRVRERGVKVVILLPWDPIPEGAKGVDWNDVLQGEDIGDFPFGLLFSETAAEGD